MVKAAAERGEARVVNHSSGARNAPSKALDAKYFGKNGGNLGGNGSSMFFGGARWQRPFRARRGLRGWQVPSDEAGERGLHGGHGRAAAEGELEGEVRVCRPRLGLHEPSGAEARGSEERRLLEI